MARQTKSVACLTLSGEEYNVALPMHKTVCPECNGEGTILNPAMGGHAYSAQEFDEEFGDELADIAAEMADAYDEAETDEERRELDEQRAKALWGRYDVTCPRCKGRNVVDRPNLLMLSPEQKADHDRYIERAEGYRREHASEIRFERGCQGEDYIPSLDDPYYYNEEY